MRRIMNFNSELPSHIIELIFSKLPILNLPVCRVVCKAWNNLILTCKFVPISSALFAHISPYENLHCVDFDPEHLKEMSIVASFKFHPRLSEIKIVNSCNGLLCFYEIRSFGTKNCVYILNPMTNEYVQLPAPYLVNFGFGFSPKSKQYKIVRISKGTLTHTLVEIFGFGKSCGKWTSVPFLPLLMDGDGVYMNGGLFWIGHHPGVKPKNVLLRFDVEDERFDEISLPQGGQDGDFHSLAIGVFNGSLYLSFYNIRRYRYHVWKMEQDSWIEEFVIALTTIKWLMYYFNPPSRGYRHQLQPIKTFKDGKILCLVSGMDLILYDPNTRKTQALNQSYDGIKEQLWIYQIESFNFGCLRKILAGHG